MSEESPIESHFLHVEENFIKKELCEDSFSNITNPLPENVSTDDLDEKPLKCEVGLIDKNYQPFPLHTGGEICLSKSCSTQPSTQHGKNTLPVPVECECCICREKNWKANFIKRTGKCGEVSFSNVTNPLPESINLRTDNMNEKPVTSETMDKNLIHQLPPLHTGGEFCQSKSCSGQQSSQNNQVSLDKHVLLTVAYHLVQCELCKSFFYVLHKGASPFQCELCRPKKSFVSKVDLSERLLGNTGERPFKCEFCEKSFFQKCSLIMHTSKRHFQCDFCQKGFAQKSALKMHLNPGEGTFQCDFCQISYVRKCALKKHLLVNSGEKFHQCDFCQKSFLQKCALNVHLRANPEVRPFQCDFCQKSFVRKCAHEEHLRVNTGERFFQCHFCQKCFFQKCALNIHLRENTGERPFECDVCPKSFDQECALKLHLRGHTARGRRFKCEFCEKSYGRKDYLKMHLRVHTGERPFKCEKCGKYFSQKSNLKYHLRVHDCVQSAG